MIAARRLEERRVPSWKKGLVNIGTSIAGTAGALKFGRGGEGLLEREEAEEGVGDGVRSVLGLGEMVVAGLS
jgi:hypothetical protein